MRILEHTQSFSKIRPSDQVFDPARQTFCQFHDNRNENVATGAYTRFL